MAQEIPIDIDNLPLEQVIDIEGEDFSCLFYENNNHFEEIVNQSTEPYIVLGVKTNSEDEEFLYINRLITGINVFQNVLINNISPNWVPISIAQTTQGFDYPTTPANIRAGLVKLIDLRVG